MTDPVRIFVGTPANNEDLECQAVLDYTLRYHTDENIEIHWMMLSRDPASPWYANGTEKKGWQTHWGPDGKGGGKWATPFSPLRWGIHAACNYSGKAIYMDCDMIALADIGELWDQKIPDDKALLMSHDGASCVMLLDCDRMRKIVPEKDMPTLKASHEFYRHLRGKVAAQAGVFKDFWNFRDGKDGRTMANVPFTDPRIKIFHYTHIPTQPNHKFARERLKREGKQHWHPGPDVAHSRPEVTELFERMFKAACDSGRGPETFRVDPVFGNYGK